MIHSKFLLEYFAQFGVKIRSELHDWLARRKSIIQTKILFKPSDESVHNSRA
jgi:hypothetical protein